jgi:hypothetical protein
MSFRYSVILVACPIANPAFIVCDACLKVAHFVSVCAVFARKINDREHSWMRWACDATRYWLPNREKPDRLDEWQSDLTSAVKVTRLWWTLVLGKKKCWNWGVLGEITLASGPGQGCRQAVFMKSDMDSCEFCKALEKARMFWYNPSTLSNQAFRDSKPSGRSNARTDGLRWVV